MLLVLFLLFVGMFIETLSATIICAPILMPVAAQYGIDPIQFALIMVITLVYAGVTPPVGGVLFITMGIAKAKMKEALTYLAPYLGIICIVILLLIFVPQISAAAETAVLIVTVHRSAHFGGAVNSDFNLIRKLYEEE